MKKEEIEMLKYHQRENDLFDDTCFDDTMFMDDTTSEDTYPEEADSEEPLDEEKTESDISDEMDESSEDCIDGLPDAYDYQNMDYKEIMVRYHNGNEWEQEQAKEDMMMYLDKYIRHILRKKFVTYTKYYADLYQEGAIGIMKGMPNYDPERAKPTTYFKNLIIHEMVEYINTVVNKTTSHYSGNIVKINKTIDKYDRLNKPYNMVDIASDTGMTLETVARAMSIKEVANEVHYDSAAMLEYAFPENFASPEDEFVKREKTRALYEAIKALPQDEATVIVLKFGILSGMGMPYKEVAKKMGLTVERVRHLYNNAIRELKSSKIMAKEFHEHGGGQRANTLEMATIPFEASDKLMQEIDNIDIDF